MKQSRALQCVCLLAVVSMPAVAVAQSELPDRFTSEDTRLTTGVDRAAASSSPASQHLLIDFMLTAPLDNGGTTRHKKPLFGAWLNARFSGSPSQNAINVSQFVGGFQQELLKSSTTSILDTVTMLGGIELSLGNGFTFGEDYQFQPLLIGGIGVTTTAAASSKPAVFELTGVSTSVRTALGVPADTSDTTYKYVAFLDPDRRRFYRQYAFGVRLKSHHFDPGKDSRQNFPGIIDFTVGRDEAITGGIMAGYVLRTDAFYPLPTNNKANSIYLFGSVEAQRERGTTLGVKDEYDQIILKPATEAITLPAKDVWMRTITPAERTRDQWRFGVGVDLVRLFSSAGEAREQAAAGCTEGGFSRKVILNNDNVTVTRFLAQDSEEGCFRHTADIILPLSDAEQYDVTLTGTASERITLSKYVPVTASDTTRKMTNATGKSVEGLLIRVKTSGTNDDPPTKNTLEIIKTGMKDGKDTFAPETVVTTLKDHYILTRMTCAMNCMTTAAMFKTSDALVVVPVAKSDAVVSVTDSGKTTTYNIEADTPIFVPKKADLQLDFSKGTTHTFDSFVVRVH